MKWMVLAAATVSVLAGCGPRGNARPWYPAYPAPVWIAQMPAPATPSAPASAPAAASAPAPPPGHDLPEKPGPFGPLQGLTLGLSRDEVAARAPGVLDDGQKTDARVSCRVQFDRNNRVELMLAYFDHDMTEELTRRWGEPRTEGEITAWLVPGDESRVVLESGGWRLRIERYLSFSKLIRGDGGKLGGVMADALEMDRKAFEARFPHLTVRQILRSTWLEVAFPPAETSSDSCELDAQFTSSGARRSIELHVPSQHSKEIRDVLRAVYGEPKQLTLCKRKGKPCEIADGVYQADPILRYRGASPEVTLWAGGYPGELTVRWSFVPTRSDHFTTMTAPQ